VTLEALSPFQINISWSFHHFEHFQSGLAHKITVCVADTDQCNVTVSE